MKVTRRPRRGRRPSALRSTGASTARQPAAWLLADGLKVGYELACEDRVHREARRLIGELQLT